jgi:glutathione synthase/RimK-type ligase-like ATP-grasp enzyme
MYKQAANPLKKQAPALLVVSKPKPKKKVLKAFRPKVRSRHPTHDPLRDQLPLLPFRSVVRLGSTTNTISDDVTHGGARVECNTVAAIKTSASKLLMKEAFTKGNVKTAEWWKATAFDTLENRDEIFPVVCKSHYGSRGKGNTLVKTPEEYNIWKANRQLQNYIVERYHDFNREYRLHVTAAGCLYACRKVLKQETPEKDRWFRNDSNSAWLLETNPTFDRPSNWQTIVNECVKALQSTGLDIGACDVKVQSAKDKKGMVRPNPEFIVIEINSAPSFGEGTLARYVAEIPKVLTLKKQAM